MRVEQVHGRPFRKGTWLSAHVCYKNPKKSIISQHATKTNYENVGREGEIVNRDEVDLNG